MDLLLAFIIFLIGMLSSVILGFSMIIPLLVGLVAFICVGMRRGFSLHEISKMGTTGAKDSLFVIEIMLLIGLLTATWRISGTITIFVYYGIKLITPSMFLIIAYLLATFLSYAIGTSFGVAGTVGIIFMALARSGNVNPLITAGVIMSGIYFGDRGSPVASALNMVSGLTGTEIYDNVKNGMKTAFLPFAITLAVYTYLSFTNPISMVDENLVKSFEEAFNLSLWSFIPALIMLALPFFKVKVKTAMCLSIISGVIIAFHVQGASIPNIIKTLVFGYTVEGDGLGSILNGGGLISMMDIAIILAISSAYSGIFNGTKMLSPIENEIGKACDKMGRGPVSCITSTLMCMVFCNQTIATLMVNNLLSGPYEKAGATKSELALDIMNTNLIIAGLVPWCIACSVPLTMFQVGYGAMAFACYMYLIPICHLILRKRFIENIE